MNTVPSVNLEASVRPEDSSKDLHQMPLTPKEMTLRAFKNAKGRMLHFWFKEPAPGQKEWWDWFENPSAEKPKWVVDRFKFTPLMVASAFGHAKAIQQMLGGEIDVNAQGRDGSTALHFAAVGGDRDTLQALVDIGVDERLKNSNQKTARQLAEEFEQWDVLNIFEEPLPLPLPSQPFGKKKPLKGGVGAKPASKKPHKAKPSFYLPSDKPKGPELDDDVFPEDFGLTMVDAHLPPHLRGKGQAASGRPPRKHASFVANLEREAPILRPPTCEPVQSVVDQERQALRSTVSVVYKKRRALQLPATA